MKTNYFIGAAVGGVMFTALLLAQQTTPLVTLPATPAAGQGGGGRGPNFPQQTRKLAAPEVIARGKALFSVNCVACHGSDLRGGDLGGPSLLHSLTALSDQHGEMISPIVKGARQDKGMPAFTSLADEDIVALAEYIHSVLAQVGNQGSPPGSRGADVSKLSILVGNKAAGEAVFNAKCASCHSVTGDLQGIASKFADLRELQNAWTSGSMTGGGRGGGGGGKPTTVSVTMASGQTLNGTLVRKDDFIVVLTTADGERRSITRNGDNPKVVTHDPNQAHKDMLLQIDDPGNKNMHDVTAYLSTLK